MAEEKYNVGDKFNSWTLLSKLPTKKRNTYWLVMCNCGARKKVSANNVYTGKSKMCRSCGAKKRWAEQRERNGEF